MRDPKSQHGGDSVGLISDAYCSLDTNRWDLEIGGQLLSTLGETTTATRER